MPLRSHRLQKELDALYIELEGVDHMLRHPDEYEAQRYTGNCLSRFKVRLEAEISEVQDAEMFARLAEKRRENGHK
jgi:hypothetical protein